MYNVKWKEVTLVISEYLKMHGYVIDNYDVIHEAMTHTSYVNEQKELIADNERLELLGDAVLQLWVSNKLFLMKPALSEGQMTTIRAQIVNEKSLANFARKLKLNKLIRLGVGEEKTGGRHRDSILADLMEAFLGALYLQKDKQNVDRCLNQVINDSLILEVTQENEDYKTKLQEYVQSDKRKTVVYEVISSKGPSNAPTFEVVVKLDEIILGKGIGQSKKKAEQEAAKDAFAKLVR